MSHSLTKIWLHGIFGTKHRQPLISEDIEDKVHFLVKKELEGLGCKVRIINGMLDHVHALFLLNPPTSVADVMKQVKGGSSHAVNQTDWLDIKFAWQTGYGAFSVSESMVKRVEEYIRNQKQHHRKQTFLEEYRQFMKNHGIVLEEQIQ